MKKVVMLVAVGGFAVTPAMANEWPTLQAQIDAAFGNRFDGTAANVRTLAAQAWCLLAQMAIAAADVAAAVADSKYGPVVGAALGLGAQYGILLPFSRTHEPEAAHVGLYYTAKAG